MPRREPGDSERLHEALAQRESELADARAKLAALEASTSLKVGRALTVAAKGPRRRLLSLPRELYRLWRGRGGRGRAAARSEPVRSYTAQRPESRLLSGLATPTDGRRIVLGALSADARAALTDHAEVVILRPHNTQIVLDAVDADLLLATASAAGPGGVWTHVGDPAVADRTRALRWAVEAAAARGVPSVLIVDAPCPAGLRSLGFDHVHEDSDVTTALRYLAHEPKSEEPPYRPAVLASAADPTTP